MLPLSIKGRGIQLVVLTAYVALGLLYLITRHNKLERFPTIISLKTATSSQYVIVNETAKTFSIYTLDGHHEKINKEELEKENGWLFDFLSREMANSECIELCAGNKRAICQCINIKTGQSYVYPYDASTKISPNYAEPRKSLFQLGEHIEKHTAPMEEDALEELERLVCAYIGAEVPLQIAITNDYVIATVEDKTRTFKLGVKEYFAEYGINGYESGEVLLYVRIYDYIIAVDSSFRFAKGQVSSYPFPNKNESILKKMSEEEQVMKMEDLKKMDYHKHVTEEEFEGFKVFLEKYQQSQPYNAFLNRLYRRTKIRLNSEMCLNTNKDE